ncbi:MULTISPECIES: Arc family DNA-binding protein [Providencia]|uniref:Arc-like DNA binding domain n=1 Tax=Providencia rettgeri TaxID=587 RepID=A0A9N8D5U1_PRORE|nr:MULTISPECIES: Arc family DNA-binding protein [Providencia]CAB5644605.1 Arc-like DNA binding domain [Providencia rettgeri]CAB5710035.1 Arc-like DNA binding domain [Providencia rettgeri]CAC9185379.1 Arc-like DNA binding domain [Providencia rettgeri]CAC9227878.1 Arc-like DNA binding domain [Providencia rettgeri]
MEKKDVQLNIRMTQELKKRIEDSARSNNRTINTEAITLIEKALSDQMSEFGYRVRDASIELSEQIDLPANEIEKLINATLVGEVTKALSISLEDVLENAKKSFLTEIDKHKK